MVAHSKRNATSSFFTPVERAELRSTWGSQSARLTGENFLPFGSCNLCLLQARDPVSCAEQGHLFCRECAISNLLAQSKEIKRLRKDAERRKAEDEQNKDLEDAVDQAKAVEDFEKVQAGLKSDTAGQKRKAEYSIDDSDAKRSRNDASSFWIPSQRHGENIKDVKVAKQNPTCPIAADGQAHSLSLATLVDVKFNEDDAKNMRTCPSCHKELSNTTKAVLATPCGHVLCKPCSSKFQRAPEKSAHDREADQVTRCYTCQEDLTPLSATRLEGKKHKKVPRGLTELKSEATGFAGGGNELVQRKGIAFQVG